MFGGFPPLEIPLDPPLGARTVQHAPPQGQSLLGLNDQTEKRLNKMTEWTLQRMQVVAPVPPPPASN